ncbi:MAG: hypothetical protein IH597_07460 [Bacteroidales bacterium]|nr:hypothetical protein [Bacteroidales bacterium]
MEHLNLNLNSDSVQSIQKSFDRIAIDLMTNWQLKVNNEFFSFTEIEFYFFKEQIHEDNATHEHNYPEGRWRFHLQGLDITFPATDDSDGGILIRGLKSNNYNVNGPKRVLTAIFINLNSVTNMQQEFGLTPNVKKEQVKIFKTFRQGLSKYPGNDFRDSLYRYYTSLETWDNKHVNNSEKERIRLKSQKVSS